MSTSSSAPKILSLLLLSCIALAATSCAIEEEADPLRQEIQEFKPTPKTSLKKMLGPTHITSQSVNRSACEIVDSLVYLQAKNKQRFSVFSRLDSNGQGGQRLDEYPFNQMILGEKFTFDSKEAFEQKVKIKCEKGEASFIECFFFSIIKNFPDCELKLQVEKTNETLEEKIPGLFGKKSDVKGSLVTGLLARLDPPVLIGSLKKNPRLREILTRSIPLIEVEETETRSVALADAVSQNLAAALDGLQSNDQEEQSCAFVLLKRAFTQLLTIKGFTGVVYDLQDPKNPKTVGAKTQELTPARTEFTKVDRPGLFRETLSDGSPSPVTLTAQVIGGYDPATRPLDFERSFLLDKHSELEQDLDLMKAMLAYFEHSSPLHEKLIDAYIFGDILAPDSAALLPNDLHLLSFGLVSMALKNLAAQHIVRVNREGKLAQHNGEVSGILLRNKRSPEPTGVLELRNLIDFSQTILQLYQTMGLTLQTPLSDLKAKNPVYTEDLFEKIALLRGNLESLKFPLAALLLKFSPATKECYSKMEWDLGSGARALSQNCDRSLRADYAELLYRWALLTDSPALAKRAALLQKN